MSSRRSANDAAPVLPHSVEGERSVLGSILLDPSALTVAADTEQLLPEHFFLRQNFHIYSHMLSLREKSVPVDAVMLVDELQRSGDLETAGGAPYISNLPDGLPRSTNIAHYARLVKTKAMLRSLANSAEAIEQQALAAEDEPSLILDRADAMIQKLRTAARATESPVGSLSTAGLFAAQEEEINWLAWPFAAVGLSSILDALPKTGKTRFLLEGIHASREHRPFLNMATQPMRVVYVSEQSKASLAMQVREVGFTGLEPIEELRWITREYWSRYVFTDFLEKLDKHFLGDAGYNLLAFDTWHTIARLEDEADASEVNRLGNLTLNIAGKNKLALTLGRHDRKSSGPVGLSGRSSNQLSGLVDVILHLVRVPNEPTQRKLELLGRVPGLPNEQLLDLIDDRYISRGEPQPPPAHVADRVALVAEWLDEQPNLSGEQIVARFAALAFPVAISVATARRYRNLAQQPNRGTK